jgi:hypothetical protein
MPIIIQVVAGDIAKAGKVARVVELLRIRLIEGSFRFSDEELWDQNRQSRVLDRPIELSVKMSENAKAARNIVRALIDFRCFGDRTRGKRKSRVFESTSRIVAEYSYPGGIDFTPGELRAFARTNALLNSWPYWREYIQTITARAGLPPLIAPLLQVRQTSLPPQPAGAKAR